jgi:hypothetical protein
VPEKQQASKGVITLEDSESDDLYVIPTENAALEKESE